MPRLLTTLERRHATRDLELARRRVAQYRRFRQRGDLAPAVREQLAADIDDLEQECSMLGTLLTDNGRTDWNMSRFASSDDTAEARPYQGSAQ